MTAQLQQISSISWLVNKNGKNAGILNKGIQNRYTYINGCNFVKFNNDTEVEQHFDNNDIFENQITTSLNTEHNFYIKGHRVHYIDPYPVEVDHPDYDPDLPLYSKTLESNVYYAAGWFCIKFNKCCKHGNGTKYTTLKKYGYEGPFKTYAECKAKLKTLNREKSQK